MSDKRQLNDPSVVLESAGKMVSLFSQYNDLIDKEFVSLMELQDCIQAAENAIAVTENELDRARAELIQNMSGDSQDDPETRAALAEIQNKREKVENHKNKVKQCWDGLEALRQEVRKCSGKCAELISEGNNVNGRIGSVVQSYTDAR